MIMAAYKHHNNRKWSWKASKCWHCLRHEQRERSKIQSRHGSPRSPAIVIVRAMVVVQRVRSIAAEIEEILKIATGNIRWGTFHGYVQALHQWRVQHVY